LASLGLVSRSSSLPSDRCSDRLALQKQEFGRATVVADGRFEILSEANAGVATNAPTIDRHIVTFETFEEVEHAIASSGCRGQGPARAWRNPD
jgi:hypothetical protein